MSQNILHALTWYAEAILRGRLSHKLHSFVQLSVVRPIAYLREDRPVDMRDVDGVSSWIGGWLVSLNLPLDVAIFVAGIGVFGCIINWCIALIVGFIVVCIGVIARAVANIIRLIIRLISFAELWNCRGGRRMLRCHVRFVLIEHEEGAEWLTPLRQSLGPPRRIKVYLRNSRRVARVPVRVSVLVAERSETAQMAVSQFFPLGQPAPPELAELAQVASYFHTV